MILDISQAIKDQGAALRFSFCEDWAPLDIAPDTVTFVGPVAVQGQAVCAKDGAVAVTGSIHLRRSEQCVRCTKPFERDYDIAFQETFVKETDEADPDCYLYRAEALDLDKMVEDNIILSMPMQSLCSQDCRGLCPVCGADRNVTQCHCADKADEANPFARLQALFDQDKEV
nr:YceD family protein [Maliibacterium massiliense]